MGFSALHYACTAASANGGSSAVVCCLLAAGARPGARDARGRTPLMLAARAGDAEVARVLMATRRANTRALDGCARSCVHYAAAAGRAEAVALLLDPEALRMSGDEGLIPPNLVPDTRGFSSWIDARSEGGVTALHLAALGGHVETLWILLASGAEPTCTTYGDLAVLFSPNPSTGDYLMLSGSTPAHYAVMGISDVRAAQCLRLLVSAGAQLDAPNDDGRTAQWVARRRGMNVVGAVLREEAAARRAGNESDDDSTISVMRELSLHSFAAVTSSRQQLAAKLLQDLEVCVEKEAIVEASVPRAVPGEAPATSKGGRQAAESDDTSDESRLCAICLERPGNIAVSPCQHTLCDSCAKQLCKVAARCGAGGARSITCPFCRGDLQTFQLAPAAPTKAAPTASKEKHDTECETT